MLAKQPPAPNQQAEEAPSVEFSRFDGLKNTVSLERLGARDLSTAINVDLDDDGQLHRRRGCTRVVTGNFHSLFQSTSGVVYGVKDNVLGIINPDYSFVALQSGIGSNYNDGLLGLSYAQIGDDIYFSSATNAGIIRTKAAQVSQWGPSQDIWYSPVVNPTATLPAVRGKLLGPPPLATTIVYFRSRIYLAAGRTLWATEPFAYGLVDKTRNFIQFDADITLLAAVADGVYVGTTEGLWFLDGPFEKMGRKRVMDSGVIVGSLSYVPAELANPPQVGVNADTEVMVSAMFMTTRGICVAMDGGRAYNLTESKFFFPIAARSATMFRRQDGMNQFIAVNDSEGQPVNGARIGDFVDAEIIRGNAMWVDVNESAKGLDTIGGQ